MTKAAESMSHDHEPGAVSYTHLDVYKRQGVDIIIECVGRNAAVDQAFSITNKGARVLLFSVPNMKSTYQLPLFEVFQKELKIMGSFINPDSHQKAVDLINMGKVKLSQLITHQYPLEQLEEAINKQMSADSIKAVSYTHLNRL